VTQGRGKWRYERGMTAAIRRPLVPEDIRNGTAAREAAAASFTRAVTSQVMARGNRAGSASQILRQAWPNDRDAEMITRAASTPAALGNTSWAGVLSMQRPADFVGMLAPSSCGLSLLQKCLQFEWPVGTSSLLVPAIDVAAPKTPWQQEGQPISNVQFAASVSAPMVPAKIASITVLSREILEYSLPSAELMVRTALGESLGLSIDMALLSSVAATSTTPAGLFYNITPLTASTNSIPSEACVEDLADITAAVNIVSGNNDVVLIASFKQAASLKARLNIIDALPCSTLPPNSVAAIASNGLASVSDTVPEFQVTTEPSVFMDTVPGAIGTTGGTQRSMYQEDIVAIRIKFKLTWILRHPSAVAWVQNVTW
jgi:hypothetical protein